jgi:MFS family permease
MEPTLHASSPPSALRWVLILGAVGFAAGFFGPLIFAPDANQGPLVGILISGPGGALLGGLLCGLCKLLRISPSRQWQGIWICSLILAFATLFLIMPKPVLRGDLEEVQIHTCRRPIEAADEAGRYWDTRMASTPGAARPGWREDSRDMLQNDEGVILGVDIIRAKTLREERKPWNKGNILASGWRPVNAQKSYYARYAGGSCSDYATGARAIVFNDLFFYGVPSNLGWPPKQVANFLDLQTLESVADPYRRFTAD